MFSKHCFLTYNSLFSPFILIMLNTYMALIMAPKIFEDEAAEANVTSNLYVNWRSTILPYCVFQSWILSISLYFLNLFYYCLSIKFIVLSQNFCISDVRFIFISCVMTFLVAYKFAFYYCTLTLYPENF